MLLLVLLIFALLFIVFLEAPRLIRLALWRELTVFLLLWGAASALAVAQFTGVELPNPIELISTILQQ